MHTRQHDGGARRKKRQRACGAQAAALNPHSPGVLKQVGRSLYLLGRHRAAVEVYDEAERAAPDDREVWHCKGASRFACRAASGRRQDGGGGGARARTHLFLFFSPADLLGGRYALCIESSPR